MALLKAAVLEKINQPLKVMDLECPSPWPGASEITLSVGQVLVRMSCAGICGAQLQEIDGLKGDPSYLPHLLGHEGSGTVQDVGLGVTRVKKGDKVVIHWRKGDGIDALPSTFKHYEPDDDQLASPDLIKSGPCTTFSEFTIVSENRVTPIPSDVPDELGALLGCCLSTALAVVENVAKIRFGESVLIIGCGGVGLAHIIAAKLAHAHPVVAIDKADKARHATLLGAQFYLANPFKDFDVIIDTCGSMSEIDALAPSGRYIMVGQPKPGVWPCNFLKMFEGEGKTIQATQAGGFNPTRDIPRYIELWRSGALRDYKKIITHRISLDQINEGIDLMRRGEAGRVMIEFTNSQYVPEGASVIEHSYVT